MVAGRGILVRALVLIQPRQNSRTRLCRRAYQGLATRSRALRLNRYTTAFRGWPRPVGDDGPEGFDESLPGTPVLPLLLLLRQVSHPAGEDRRRSQPRLQVPDEAVDVHRRPAGLWQADRPASSSATGTPWPGRSRGTPRATAARPRVPGPGSGSHAGDAPSGSPPPPPPDR